MKAVYIRRPGADFALEERPIPALKSDEILVRVDSVAICHTDLIFRQGLLNDSHSFPLIPGHEFSGTVEAVGDGVKYVSVGDKGAVLTILRCHGCPSCHKSLDLLCENFEELGSTKDGGYAQYCVCPAHCFVKIRHPEKLEQMCLAEPLANALAATERARIQPGETVVVIGPGAIGLLACRAARQYNPARVILVGTRDQRLAVGRNFFDVDETLNIRREGAQEELIYRVLKGKGADVIIDCSGALSGFEMALRLLKPRSRIILEGYVHPEDTLPFSPRILHQNCSLLAVEGWTERNFQQAVELIDQGIIDTSPLITHRFGIEEWAEAFEVAEKNRTEAIRVVIKPWR